MVQGGGSREVCVQALLATEGAQALLTLAISD